MRSSPMSTIRSCSPWACLLIAVVIAASVLSSKPAGAETLPAEAAVSGVRQVAAGDYHSCALLANTQVRCVGDGELGQLGQGAPADSVWAVTVKNPAGTGPLVNVVQIAAGYEHTCALLANGEVRCWGYNGDGELGDGTIEDRHLPVPVKGVSGTGRLRNVTQISAGGENTCARLTNGQVRCWGHNSAGQIGDGTVGGHRQLPVVVLNPAGTGPLTHVTQVDAGFQGTCARVDTGQARCWGRNNEGQVGDGTTQPRYRPTVVKNGAGSGPLTHVTQVAIGAATQACALLDSGQARCWGGNAHRELAHGTAVNAVLPVVVTNASGTGPLRGIRQLTAGFFVTCAGLTNGQARCWGDNSTGQLGRGPIGGSPRRRPKPVNLAAATPLTGVTQLDITESHVCARLSSGRARCWGYGTDGQLGQGAGATSGTPVLMQQ